MVDGGVGARGGAGPGGGLALALLRGQKDVSLQTAQRKQQNSGYEYGHIDIGMKSN